MLFNSYGFLFGFLPLVLLTFFALGRLGRTAGSTWLAVASIFFYGWWNYRYLPLLLGSIVVNYLIGRRIATLARTPAGKRLLVLGVVLNLSLLVYYKYADLLIGGANDLLGQHWHLLNVVLPIGISFFTFTQIAYLADAYSGLVSEYRFSYYTLFVTYFPHLIAGPVLHHKEMMPQFDQATNYRPHASNFAIGLTTFAIGLAKKVLLADNLGTLAAPVFAGTDSPTLLIAWGGVLAYTFQLYFDFSGYSDMAIGLSRLFGVRLPLNFDSPYKASSISEFWRRWHMTLSRFLRDYLYITMGGNRKGPVRRQVNLMVTMVLGGLWHGAGWNFAVWGALHGAFLVINHCWNELGKRLSLRGPRGLAKMAGTLLTFVCVVFAWVFFRATNMVSANQIVWGMLGGFGTQLPAAILDRLGGLQPMLQAWGVGSSLGGGGVFVETWAWVTCGALIAFALPNTQEIMSRFEPALPNERSAVRKAPAWLSWRPGRAQAVACGVLIALGVLAFSRPTEFLYFQF